MLSWFCRRACARPAVGQPATPATSASNQPEVTAVTVSGDANAPNEELMKLLRLEVGDRFDFHRWQGDIDRLREYYHDQNHYELRVRGARQISEDGKTVAL